MNRLSTLSLLALALVAITVTALPAQQITSPNILATFHINAGYMISTTLTPLASGGVRVEYDVDADHVILDLHPHSVRAYNYTVMLNDGTRRTPAPAAPETTYRGVMVGFPGTEVAASILPNGVFARIKHPNGGDQWIQPMNEQIPTAPASMQVIYNQSDVLPTNNTNCIEVAVPGTESVPLAGTPLIGGDLRTAVLSCDADYEYYANYGKNAGNVQNRINAVINAMNLQYSSEVNLTHWIDHIEIRTNKRSSYKGKNASSLLSKLRSEWLNNLPAENAAASAVHYFSGKSLSGGTIGIAWVGAVCNNGYHFGLVESDFNNNFACATDLSAHELGHNWNASHCSCTSHTMNPYITCANTFNSSITRPVIVAYANAQTCF